MAKKNKTTLKELYHDKLVYSKVKAMLEDKYTYAEIIRFLHTKGYELSRGTISNLRSKLDESMHTGVSMDELIDKRKKSNVTKLPNLTGFKGKPTDSNNTKDIVVGETSKHPLLNGKTQFYSSEQVLDSIIDRGINLLNQTTYLDTGILMKALDLKAKYYSNDSKGLSIDALQQYQIITNAKLTALQQVVMEFIPKDKQDLAFKKMDEAEQEVLNNVEMQDGGKDLIAALKKAGLDLS